jgi:hypothetical protein
MVKAKQPVRVSYSNSKHGIQIKFVSIKLLILIRLLFQLSLMEKFKQVAFKLMEKPRKNILIFNLHHR